MQELIDPEFGEFFAPASTDMVDGLVGQYKQQRARIDKVAEIMAGELGGVVSYFIDGNKSDRDGWYRLDKLFDPAGAVGALNSDFWQRALALTDVMDCMPQKRRDEWYELIREHKAPDFEEDTVRETIGGLLASRSKFFAERVDGIFRTLSGTHVTNRPEGFGKRMIISGVVDSFGSMSWSRAGVINDLRCVIAKFMGRDEPKHGATDAVIRHVRQHNGEWASIDGGALRMRIYNGVGTAHLEVHPDMAWRLNGILASLYPAAIPPKFRQRPKKQPKEHVLMQRPLPFAVLSLLGAADEALEPTGNFRQPYRKVRLTRTIRVPDANKHALAEAESILEAIGGVREKWPTYNIFRFDYEPESVIGEILCNGCVPDDKTHQFYPTPEGLAAQAVALAEIEPGHKCIEPSAGIGGLADLIGPDTVCVEVSKLRCNVLEAKGYAVTQADFLELAPSLKPAFDRVVMNPPFSANRWRDHLEAAGSVVKSGGRLVAILPASARGNDLLPGWQLEWHGPYDNEFAGTSVSVVILVANRGAA